MKQEFFNFQINTNGQKLYEFTNEAINWVKKNNLKNGILNLLYIFTNSFLCAFGIANKTSAAI